jgi:hypothetical protein
MMAVHHLLPQIPLLIPDRCILEEVLVPKFTSVKMVKRMLSILERNSGLQN